MPDGGPADPGASTAPVALRRVSCFLLKCDCGFRIRLSWGAGDVIQHSASLLRRSVTAAPVDDRNRQSAGHRENVEGAESGNTSAMALENPLIYLASHGR
jgi:hypothetical protein